MSLPSCKMRAPFDIQFAHIINKLTKYQTLIGLKLTQSAKAKLSIKAATIKAKEIISAFNTSYTIKQLQL